ncbi:hypothetical protein [Bacillus xiamenensis]|uniref:hypothetical protein n=1 Tax=Bacillus xiamenensis TaxID=1178537 RepID=UPI0009E27475
MKHELIICLSSKDLFELIAIIKEKKANLESLKDSSLDLSNKSPYNDFSLTVMAGVNRLD